MSRHFRYGLILALVSVVLAYKGAKKSSPPTITPIPLDRLPRPSALALPPAADDDDDDLSPFEIEGGQPALNTGATTIPPILEARPDIAALIAGQPEDVANTLRDWLADRRS